MTTIQGVLSGQRCARCKGAVRWNNAAAGERPTHIWAQDFADAAGRTHLVTLESGQPTHYWAPGVDGSPDRKVAEESGTTVELRPVQGPRTDHVDDRPVFVAEWDHPEAPGAYAANTPLTPEGPSNGE